MTFIDSCAERSVSSLWETVISVLGASGFTNVEINFVKTLHFVGVEKGICILETQNKFTRDWAEKHFSKRILKILVFFVLADLRKFAQGYPVLQLRHPT